MGISLSPVSGGTNFKMQPHVLSPNVSIPVNGSVSVLSVTGPCILRRLQIGYATYGCWLRITIDGVVMASPYDGTQRWYGGGSQYLPPQRPDMTSSGSGFLGSSGLLTAKKSMLIEFLDKSGSGWTGQGYIEYSA